MNRKILLATIVALQLLGLLYLAAVEYGWI